MNTISLESFLAKNKVLLFAFCAILFTQFLFFIDEGYYDFRWMKSIGNWIVFPVYTVPIFLCQLGFSWLIRRITASFWGTIASVVLGSIVGTVIVANLIFSHVR